MYNNLIDGFCSHCLSIRNNSDSVKGSVEELIREALEDGEAGNIPRGCTLMYFALVALMDNGGCESSINILRDTIETLTSQQPPFLRPIMYGAMPRL